MGAFSGAGGHVGFRWLVQLSRLGSQSDVYVFRRLTGRLDWEHYLACTSCQPHTIGDSPDIVAARVGTVDALRHMPHLRMAGDVRERLLRWGCEGGCEGLTELRGLPQLRAVANKRSPFDALPFTFAAFPEDVPHKEEACEEDEAESAHPPLDPDAH